MTVAMDNFIIQFNGLKISCREPRCYGIKVLVLIHWCWERLLLCQDSYTFGPYFKSSTTNGSCVLKICTVTCSETSTKFYLEGYSKIGWVARWVLASGNEIYFRLSDYRFDECWGSEKGRKYSFLFSLHLPRKFNRRMLSPLISIMFSILFQVSGRDMLVIIRNERPKKMKGLKA
ncbi:hypothetical protein CEXT_599961 [Caerostris extrusa]|uniref:Uncharacterized protein n=1 Tax=Caerostris extrusa TaxID=172846 RepID=A0AAV4NQE4_CAEEX|nr:hypothetical protein CEXT_599961 [Caerostris extrusa]